MQTWQVIAGSISSVLFVIGALPMLYKAFQTRELKSYSPGNLLLSNLGNLIYWLYVASLPIGPIWFLHGFWSLTTALMLVWYIRYETGCSFSSAPRCLSKPLQCFSQALKKPSQAPDLGC